MEQIILSQIPLTELVEHIVSAMRQERATQAEAETAPKNLLTQAQICDKLDISPQTIIRWRKLNKVPFILIGNRPRYDLSAVMKALNGSH